MKCNIIICPKPGTWVGTLNVRDWPEEEARPVTYCDDHAYSQINSVPAGLVLHLVPKGQKARV